MKGSIFGKDQMLFLRVVAKCNTSHSSCFHGYQHLLYYSSCTSTSANDSYSNYLVNSLSFSQQQALPISTKLSRTRRNNKVVIGSKFVDNANSVVTLFRHLGFHDTLIKSVVSKEPRVLTSNVDKTLKLKFRALQDQDFSRSHIIRVISKRPEILFYGLESTILPTIRILSQVMGSVSNVVCAIERLNKIYIRNVVKCLLPNVAFLSNSYGVPIELIRMQLLYKPGYFVQNNPKVFRKTMMRTDKKLGITRDSSMNMYRVNLISGMSEENFDSKRQIFESFGTNQLFSNYLVYHLGFSHQQALSTCTKLSQQWKKKVIGFEFIDNVNSVVALFRKHGFDDALIRDIVSKEPRLLASSIDKTLKPKIKVLQDEDFSSSEIIRIISRYPTILLCRLESTILPAILVLKQVMGSNGKVINIIERLRWRFLYIIKCLLPNVALLTSGYGVPIELIRKHMLYKPECYVQNPEVFKDKVIRVENKFKITRDSPMFLYGINLISKMSEETFESKCRIFKNYGWTQSDLGTLMINNICCFTSSEESIKKKLDFLMNELQLKPAYLKSRIGFITCSLRKRIVPRHKILLILKEKGLLKNNLSLYSAIKISQPCFLMRFVLPYEEVHEAYAELSGCTVEMLTPASAVSLHQNPIKVSGHPLSKHCSQLDTQSIEPILEDQHEVENPSRLPSLECTSHVQKSTAIRNAIRNSGHVDLAPPTPV